MARNFEGITSLALPPQGKWCSKSVLVGMEGSWSKAVDHQNAPQWLPHSICMSLHTRQLKEYLSYSLGSARAQALQQEVGKIVEKGAVQIVHDQVPAFHTRLFLVKNASGGLRPVIDLSLRNTFVAFLRLRMEAVTLVLASVQEGDFMSLIDL